MKNKELNLINKIKNMSFLLKDKKKVLQAFSDKYPVKYRVEGSKVCRVMADRLLEIIEMEQELEILSTQVYGKAQCVKEGEILK